MYIIAIRAKCSVQRGYPDGAGNARKQSALGKVVVSPGVRRLSMEPKAVTALQQTLTSSSSVISKTLGSTLLQAASEPRLCARRGSWSPAHLLTARSVSCAANRPRVTECCTKHPVASAHCSRAASLYSLHPVIPTKMITPSHCSPLATPIWKQLWDPSYGPKIALILAASFCHALGADHRVPQWQG